MRRILITLFSFAFATLLMAGPVSAANPHFIHATGALNADGSLTVSFKEAGLGNNQLIDYVLSADATATWVCVNRGGANPSASNKTTVSGPVSAEGTFSSGQNGQITESLTVQPPGLDSSFSCPRGQRLQLANVSYSNILLTDTTNGVSIGIADASSGCLLPNVRGACD